MVCAILSPVGAARTPRGGDPMYVFSDVELCPAYVPLSNRFGDQPRAGPSPRSLVADAGPMYVECLDAEAEVHECRDVEAEVHAVPRPKRRRARHGERRRRCHLQIASHLKELLHEDPSCVLLLRQINRLGFDSPELLRAHYLQYGGVVKVLVSNTQEKDGTLPYPVRVRPSGIGFVLMDSPGAASAARAQGTEQTVSGVQVKVLEFQRRPHCASGSEDELETTSASSH